MSLINKGLTIHRLVVYIFLSNSACLLYLVDYVVVMQPLSFQRKIVFALARYYLARNCSSAISPARRPPCQEIFFILTKAHRLWDRLLSWFYGFP